MPSASPVEVVREFWCLMQSNDFTPSPLSLRASSWLEWPQSKERIHGAERFASRQS